MFETILVVHMLHLRSYHTNFGWQLFLNIQMLYSLETKEGRQETFWKKVHNHSNCSTGAILWPGTQQKMPMFCSSEWTLRDIFGFTLRKGAGKNVDLEKKMPAASFEKENLHFVNLQPLGRYRLDNPCLLQILWKIGQFAENVFCVQAALALTLTMLRFLATHWKPWIVESSREFSPLCW